MVSSNLSADARSFIAGCAAIGVILLYAAWETQSSTSRPGPLPRPPMYHNDGTRRERKETKHKLSDRAIKDLSTRELKVLLKQRGIVNAGIERQDLERTLSLHIGSQNGSRVLFSDDLVLEIISFLEDIHDVLRVSLVCTHWARVASCDSIWEAWCIQRLSGHIRTTRVPTHTAPWRRKQSRMVASQFMSSTWKLWVLLRKACSGNTFNSFAEPSTSTDRKKKLVASPISLPPRRIYPLHLPPNTVGWKQLLANTHYGLFAIFRRDYTVQQKPVTKRNVGGHHLIRLLQSLAVEFNSVEAACGIMMQFVTYYALHGNCSINDVQGFVFKLPPPERGSVSCSHNKFRSILVGVGLNPNLLEDWLGPYVDEEYGCHLLQVVPNSKNVP